MKKKIEKLEMLRGFAAAYIVAGHFLYPALHLQGRWAGLPLLFGQEAVIVFFLLSGFVIYYSTHQHRDQSFGGYFKRRFIRIYPIFVLAVALACLLGGGLGTVPGHWQELLGNLVMLQDASANKPGVWIEPAYGNGPLWSLSYEWWFYLLFFPIYKWVAPAWQLPAAAAISLVGLLAYAWHPSQPALFLLYFILWWSGLELARTYCTGTVPTFSTQRGSLLILAAFCALVGGVMLGWMPRPPHLSHGLHPLLEIRHFAAAPVLVCLSLGWARCRWRGFAAIFGVFSLLAPVSYAIYVFHFPIGMCLLRAEWIPFPLLRVGVAAVLTLVLAYLAEVPLQRLLNHWTRRPRKLPGLDPAREVPV